MLVETQSAVGPSDLRPESRAYRLLALGQAGANARLQEYHAGRRLDLVTTN